MKKYSTLLGAAVVGLSATASWATVTASYATFAINTSLQAAGFVGYAIQLSIDGSATTGIRGFDFANDGYAEDPVGGNIGIRGALAQHWTTDNVNPPGGTIVPSTYYSTNPAQDLRVDSFFNSGVGSGLLLPLGVGGNDQNFGIAENLNSVPGYPIANVPGTPGSYTAGGSSSLSWSPGTNGEQYGVGSFMTLSAAYNNMVTSAKYTVAFVIADPNSPVTVRGIVADQNNDRLGIDFTIPGTAPIPEPASLGLLALGGLSLLARRRRA